MKRDLVLPVTVATCRAAQSEPDTHINGTWLGTMGLGSDCVLVFPDHK